MAMEPHTRLPTATAREYLRPLGLVQKGRSRTWLDDHGWFVTGVEFQPSGWSKGTYQGWPYYHYAVSLGLSGKSRRAARIFRQIAEASQDDRDWVLVKQEQCIRLAGLVKDPPAFRGAIDELIAGQRAALKLPALDRVLSA